MNTDITVAAIRNQHRKLWLWLAENPKKEKHHWPGWETEEVKAMIRVFPDIWIFKCFACYKGHGADKCGGTCPIQTWILGKPNTTTIACSDENSMFTEWRGRQGDNERKAELAAQIANAWE